MFKKSFALLLAALLVMSMTAIAEVKVTDFAGKEVTLDKAVERIVVLTPSDCEILYALGAGDLVVGRGTYCDFPAEAAQKEEVKSGKDMNLEQIIALKPDVVVLAKMGHTEEQVQALENAGIKTIVSDAQDIAGVYACIEMLGALVGREQEAAALVGDMKSAFEDVIARVNGREAGTVYFEVSPLQYGLWAACSHTFMNELAQMLGLENIFGDLEGWQSVSEEQVISEDPTFIVTTSMYFGEGPTPMEEIMGREGWKEMTALTEGNIINADSNEITRPGPRLVEAIEQLYTFVYERENAADKAA